MTGNGVPIDLDKLGDLRQQDSGTVGQRGTARALLAVSVNGQSAKMAALKFYVITFEFPSGTTHTQASWGDCHTHTHTRKANAFCYVNGQEKGHVTTIST